ncbi:MAG: DNA-3-methyladenine glycosylase [Trueperaceae bacterium]
MDKEAADGAAMTSSSVDLRLCYQPPLDWSSLLGFLALRATPGVELVDGDAYRRSVRLGGTSGIIEVSRIRDGNHLLLRAPAAFEPSLPYLRSRIERIFDLTTATADIAAQLTSDATLGSAVTTFPGIRVPGSWAGFETAVRAILGQVVSVKAATALAGRLVARHGEELGAQAVPGLSHLFPTPERLADADLTELGLSGQKMRSIGALAREVASGRLRLDSPGDTAATAARLLTLPGVGPWTVQYISMRALGESDAFPAGDLILRRAAAPKPGVTLTEAGLTALAERWRPWRAYAAMLLWASYSAPRPAPGSVAGGGA